MSTEAETTSATGTVATPTKVAPPKEGSAPNTPSKETDEARTQLVQGRRHLLVKDYFSAVAALAKGCELLAQKFGDTAPELGDAYLTYGRALLELARSESGVLGLNEEGENAEGEDDEEDGDGEEGEDEDDGEEAEKDAGEAKENGEAVTESKENGEAASVAKENGKEAEAKVNGTEAKENGAETKTNGTEAKENGSEAKNGTDSANGKEGTDGAADADQTLKEEEEEEDDVNNLQLAWEILELAKSIFQKQIEEEKEPKQTCLKLAEVHLKLGEVGVESENYTTAVEDMKSCLELQKKYLDEDDRRIAETLYNMGMAYSLANEFDAAIEQFKFASEQIEKRLANLEKKKAEPAAAAAPEKAETDDPFYTVQGEIEELKALLPEMKEKVSDMQDFKKETMRRMMDGLAEASAKKSSTADGAGPSSASASDKPVSSVAHLVKRKPKDEAAEKTEASPTKGSPAKASPTKTSPVKTDAATAEKTEEEVSDRKRKPEDPVEVEDATKKAKVDESAESKPSE